MINFLVWIVAGAAIGWIASIIMGTNSRQGLIADILVGIVGSFLGGYFLGPLFNVGTINEGDFSISALLVSLGGAIILLAVSRLFRIISSCIFVLFIALLVYLYFNCWVMEASSLFCTSVRTLPFLQ